MNCLSLMNKLILAVVVSVCWARKDELCGYDHMGLTARRTRMKACFRARQLWMFDNQLEDQRRVQYLEAKSEGNRGNHLIEKMSKTELEKYFAIAMCSSCFCTLSTSAEDRLKLGKRLLLEEEESIFADWKKKKVVNEQLLSLYNDAANDIKASNAAGEEMFPDVGETPHDKAKQHVTSADRFSFETRKQRMGACMGAVSSWAIQHDEEMALRLKFLLTQPKRMKGRTHIEADEKFRFMMASSCYNSIDASTAMKLHDGTQLSFREQRELFKDWLQSESLFAGELPGMQEVYTELVWETARLRGASAAPFWIQASYVGIVVASAGLALFCAFRKIIQGTDRRNRDKKAKRR